MFTIYDGRKHFYQWDLNQKLIVEDSTITEVHFANCLCSNARVVETYTEGALTLVNVPSELLQEYLDINVYAYDGEKTKHNAAFEVYKRTKPSDYVYTDTELREWETLAAQISALEKRVKELEIRCPKMIAFTVNGEQYEVAEGTMWEEFIDNSTEEYDCDYCGSGFTHFNYDSKGVYFTQNTVCYDCEPILWDLIIGVKAVDNIEERDYTTERKEITFTVNGDEYNTSKGTTWEEFIDYYNTEYGDIYGCNDCYAGVCKFNINDDGYIVYIPKDGMCLDCYPELADKWICDEYDGAPIHFEDYIMPNWDYVLDRVY